MTINGDQYSRQSFLGGHSQEVFRNLRAGVVGLGGGGSHIAQQLAHIGVGHLALFDPDVMEFPNLNRTVGSTFADAIAGTPKVRVAERLIKSVNPGADVWPIQSPWQKDFAALRSCDVIFGCIDGFSRREQLEKSCRRALIPLIDVGMDVFKGDPFAISGQVILSMPGYPCMRCMHFIKQSDLDEEGRRYGEAGGNPQVVWTNGVLASTAVGMFVQLFTPWCRHDAASGFIGHDGNKLTLEQDARLKYAAECQHFSQLSEIGDPFWQG